MHMATCMLNIKKSEQKYSQHSLAKGTTLSYFYQTWPALSSWTAQFQPHGVRDANWNYNRPAWLVGTHAGRLNSAKKIISAEAAGMKRKKKL